MRSAIAVLLVLVTTRAARADEGDRWDGLTLAAQTGAGIGGAWLGGAAGALIGVALGKDKGKLLGELGHAIVGAAVGSVAGSFAGVQLAGDARDGTGSWGATLAGSLVGGVVSFVVVPQLPVKLPDPVLLGVMSLTLTAPAIVGYHLSADDSSGDALVMVPLVLGWF